MAPFSYEPSPKRGTAWPSKRSIVGGRDFQLDHFSLPAASLRHANLPAHTLAVQTSSAVRFRQRIDGRNVGGWMAARSSEIAPAGFSSSSTWDDDREIYALYLAPCLFDRLLRDEKGGASFELVHRHIGVDPFLAEAVRLMAHSAAADGPFGSLFLEGLMTALVAHLARHNLKPVGPARRGGLSPRQLRSVLDVIEESLGEDVSLTELAAEAGLSERYFCTAFRQTVGTSPYRFMLERRITRAKDMLRSDSALRITDVAMAVGFSTSAHFASTFRNLTGMTPSSFRSRD